MIDRILIATADGGLALALPRVADRREPICVHIRWMIRRDMADVLETEQQSFEFTWTEEDFLRCLRRRDCVGMVAEQGEKVVGFMMYELHKHSLEVINFAVHPGFRCRTVGRQMVDKLKAKLSGHHRNKIGLRVRDTNLPAQQFFAAMGFAAVRVERGYYVDSGDDAYRMVYRLED